MTTLFPPGTWLWVALGGALGSALRFGVSDLTRRVPALLAYPWATLTVNVSGSLFLGALTAWVAGAAQVTPQLRAFLMLGVLGGYTTFSAFALEGLTMLQAGQPLRALGYATASVLLAVAAAGLGWSLMRGAA